MNKIRQSEFVQLHGISPVDIKAIRDEHLSDADWWKEGVVIYWSAEAAERVKLALFPDKEPESPDVAAIVSEPESEIDKTSIVPDLTMNPVEEALTVRVLKRARNYRFVYATYEGERIAVLCPKKGRKNIIGKSVKVKRETVDGQTTYTLIP